jgi:two-component system sensor histidine kinase KdpD
MLYTIPSVYTKRMVETGRWLVVANAIAGIVALFHFVITQANHTTVALTLLLLVLVLAGNWGLRYAVVASIAGTVFFNFFFLPPVNTFTIADTQNWVALFAFLGTAIYASHLASRIREESEEANARRRESEMLYRLGRQLLQPENVGQLLNFLPSSVASAFNSPAVTLYIADGDRIYLSDPKHISSPNIAWCGDEATRPPGYSDRGRTEIVHDLREAMLLPVFRPPNDGCPAAIPLRIGVRPSGALLLEATPLSRETMEALSGLVSMSIERAQALENSARSEAAKETERLRTALLDSVTHELRTPLTSIKASVSALLSQQALDDHSRNELLTVIDEESDRLNHLIEQAVEMAQLDAHKVHLQPKPQSITPLIDAAVEQSHTTDSSREIRVSLSANLPNVVADAAWIEKVLLNLLGNAMKYSPSNQPIFVSASTQGDMLAISVADRGAGIDPLEQGMIFDKFYRGRSYRDPAGSNRVSGTGMGLAICRAIVTAHGGTIGVTSQLGHGSVFTFTLPTVRP